LQRDDSPGIVYGEDGTAKTVAIKGHQLKPILIVIDVQNGFVSEGGSYDKLGIDRSHYLNVLPNIRRLVQICREIGMPVLFTQSIREPSGMDLLTKTHKVLPLPREERIEEVPICVRGTWDADIVEGIKPDKHRYIITKRRDSAFHGTGLENLLRELEIDSVIFCGIDTSMCVETSLRDAFNIGFDVMVISDATASMNPRRYECTLDDVRSFYGLVLDTEEFTADVS
jgi:ureidoacrylate peracid hydrolase